MFACKEYALFSFARDEWLDKYAAVGVGSRSCKANDFQVSRSIFFYLWKIFLKFPIVASLLIPAYLSTNRHSADA